MYFLHHVSKTLQEIIGDLCLGILISKYKQSSVPVKIPELTTPH